MAAEENLNSINMDPLISGDRITIPVIEEHVKFDRKVIETGKVNISKVVYEDVDSYTIPYTEEQVTVERVPKNIIVDAVPPAIRYEDDVMIISVLKEVPVVEKRIMLVEELHVTKIKTEKTETHEVSLRKEEVEVNRTEIRTSV
jgi:stress response protein YsnF